MFIMHQFFGAEFASAKFFSKKETLSETNVRPTEKQQELNEEAERVRNERIENFITLIPLIVMLLGIIVMTILYKIFM